MASKNEDRENGQILNIAIVDKKSDSAQNLYHIFEQNEHVRNIYILPRIKDVLSAIQRQEINCVFIDPFFVGVVSGINFISELRRKYRHVPICLFSNSDDLQLLPGVAGEWRHKFREHYHSVAKDDDPDALFTSIEHIISMFPTYVLTDRAKESLDNMRNSLVELKAQSSLPPEMADQFEEAIVHAVRALEQREKIAKKRMPDLLPGISELKLRQLVDQTLQQAKKMNRLTSRANVGVLALGALLVVASVVAAIGGLGKESILFGSLGLAGVVTATITNTLNSIKSNAKRLVEVEIAYLSFLKQIEVLSSDRMQPNDLDRSKRLEEAVVNTLSALNEQS